MGKKIIGSFAIFLTLTANGARAQLLDDVLPDDIPGYGTPFAVSAAHPPRPQPTGLSLGDATLVPQVSLTSGYDSAPNGAASSSLYGASPSLLLADPVLGFGAYAAANATQYPQDSPQNISGYTLAMGERAVLPTQTIVLAGGLLDARETSFALDTIAIPRPIAFSLADLRVSDEIAFGPFTLKPELSTTDLRFPSYAAQNRRDDREDVTGTYLPNGPIQYVIRLRATQSAYRMAIFNANTDQALAGLRDTADGLWRFSALAGAARRVARYGPALTAPVLEAGLDWMPSELDRVRLSLAREIDDPDEVSATPYTLSEIKVSFAHEVFTDLTFKFSAQASNAAYMHSRDRESLYSTDISTSWQLDAALAATAEYGFNDRQANYLRAANEHIVTLGVIWTP